MSTEKTNNADDNVTAEVQGQPVASVLDVKIPDTLLKKVKSIDDFKENYKNSGKITIKPFIDNTRENMGLENYNMTVFPGTYHEEQLAALENNGLVRYISGLDEFAPEVQGIPDEETREAVIYNIRSIVIYLEKILATNVLKIDDENFWSKVKKMRPDNHAFWSTVTLRCGNETVFLDPINQPMDLIKIVAIEAGGFDAVAKSYEDAMARPVAPKWYLDKEVITVSARTTDKRLRNQAAALLDKLANNNHKKMFYISKILSSNGATYKNSTPADILYDVLDDYINGKGVESNTKKAAQYFIETVAQDMETLKLRALVKDASFFKVISLKGDGMLYHTKSNSILGRNVTDVVVYLKNPLNEDMLTKLLNEIGTHWDK